MSEPAAARRRRGAVAVALIALLAVGVVLVMREVEPGRGSSSLEGRATAHGPAPEGKSSATLEAKPADPGGDASRDVATSVPVSVAGASRESARQYLHVRELTGVDAATGRPLGPDDLAGGTVTGTEAGPTATLGWSYSPRTPAEFAAARSGRPIALTSWVPDAYPTFSLTRRMDASAAIAVVPLHRAFDLAVRCVDATGRTLLGATCLRAVVGRDVLPIARHHEEWLRRNFIPADGAQTREFVTERYVPFFPGEPLWVVCEAPVPLESRTSAMRKAFGESDRVRAVGGVVLPARWQPRVDVVVTFDDAHLAATQDLPVEESLGEQPVSAVLVNVRVLARDGT